MPELPEVQTTARGIDRVATGYTITDVWTDFNSPHYHGSDTIKDPAFFTYFKKQVVGTRILGASRRAKNVLINLGGAKDTTKQTILIHMKMTGHILFGKYEKKSLSSAGTKTKKVSWLPLEKGPLQDPFNKHIRLVFTLEKRRSGHKADTRHLVLCDTRRFAKVTLVDTDKIHASSHLSSIGPEPLEPAFTFSIFKKRLHTKPNGRIKQTLMDQTIIAGVGNIYADESLWRAGIHPEERVKNISDKILMKLYTAMQTTLRKGIDFGGDSMSDYRNIDGERGRFQEQHRAYRKTSSPCEKPGCKGKIIRRVIAGRSGHFCDTHQRLRGVK